MTNTELLEEKIKESGLKKSFIAKTLGISMNCLTGKINNKSEFTVSQVERISGLLGIESFEEQKMIFFAQ